MDKVYLQWNLVNWITVVIMASLGVVLFGIVASGVKTLRGDASE